MRWARHQIKMLVSRPPDTMYSPLGDHARLLMRALWYTHPDILSCYWVGLVVVWMHVKWLNYIYTCVYMCVSLYIYIHIIYMCVCIYNILR